MGTILLLGLLFDDIRCVHLAVDVLIDRWQGDILLIGRVVTRNASVHNLCDDDMRVDISMI